MQYVGIDWAYRRAAWCVKTRGGEVQAEGVVPADEDGLAKMVLGLGPEVTACVEMMSGAVWVRDRLRAAGWSVEIADARKVKAVAPLACKTDKVDARVLAELCRRDLVPAVWVPSLSDRELRERLNRRAHLIRLRTAARNRVFGALTQWGLRIPVRALQVGDPMALLEQRGLPEVWRRSVAEALAVIDFVDARIGQLDAELHPIAQTDPRVALLVTIPGVGEQLGLVMASEIGDIARFPGRATWSDSLAWRRESRNLGRARELVRSPAPAPARCGGRRSKPRSARGGRRTRGTGSTSTSSSAPASPIRPRARSRARC
ncbi:MAG: transposase [Solirubrobacterales bacterium]|nr:transposase [Solirubrobacterales bacterium]